MASAFTHALVGIAITAGAPRTLRRKRLAALLVAASVVPDLDVIAFGLGIPYSSPLGHRGLTHSVLFAAAIATMAAWLLEPRLAGTPPDSPVERKSSRRVRRSWIAALTFATIASHGLLDALTDGGLGVGFWIPFDGSRYFLPWRPIPVSPIGLGAFASARGVEILAAEMRWIWIPLALTVFGLRYFRRWVVQRAGGRR